MDGLPELSWLNMVNVSPCLDPVGWMSPCTPRPQAPLYKGTLFKLNTVARIDREET